MKNNFIVLVAAVLMGCGGTPNLMVKGVALDLDANTVMVTLGNVGDADAGENLTYIEINEVGVSSDLTPQSQYSAEISGLAAGAYLELGPIAFSEFSSPRGLVLEDLVTANIVVRADAKNMVRESNEDDNVWDQNY